jgi:diguanylate cyclase (GGDEF)-like protein/PAS domain S-box-containing protein
MASLPPPGGPRLAGRVATLWVPTALTVVAFVALYRFGLVGDLPLPVLVGLLVAAAAFGEMTARSWQRGATSRQVHVAIAIQMISVTAIIYAIGWGPTLAIGYTFLLARALDQLGSRVWRPMLWWTGLGIAGGEVAIAVDLVPSYLPDRYAHGIAGLSFLGVGFVIHLLGTKTAAEERAKEALSEQHENFRQLFAANPQPMWVYDAATLAFLEVNAAAVHAYGYSRDEFLARHVPDIWPPDDVPSRLAELELRGLVAPAGQVRHRLRDGRVIDAEIRSHALAFRGHDAVLVAAQDVTQRNALEAELRHQAFHDSLTGLANRALFADRIDHAIRRLHRDDKLAAVLLVDLDRFKNVNDSLGHTVGDKLLVEVAGLLQGMLREGDTAARLGGDEFGILLEDLDSLEDANAAAQRIIDALHEPFCLDGKEVFVHASIGVTMAGVDGANAEELLRNADAAMYGAKSDGKGRYRTFEPAMHLAALARLEMEADLRRAIALEEFVVHYQPIVSLATRRVRALEALVRWQHPTRGLVGPSEFVPLAEETGLIVELGRLVLREACRRAAEWKRTAPGLTVAVNLSARQLADRDLVHDVAAALAAAGLVPDSLTLEITESVLIEDRSVALARLHELKAAGVRLAIDDFGTGYSSLSSLRELPVDTVKIDKSFIDGITDGADAASVVQAIIRLAGTLELDAVAEGVEADAQLRELRALGCEHVQGFCFSRAVPPEEVATLLAAPLASHVSSPTRADAGGGVGEAGALRA